MDAPEITPSQGSEARRFLTRLWHLDNEERPGFLIGYAGGKVSGGSPVRSALFSTEGADTVRDRLLDPAKFLRAQLEEIRGMLPLKGDYVPTLCPALGVIGIPSAFGCEVVWWEKDFPAVKARIGGDPKEVYALPDPSVTDGELGRVLRYTEFLIRNTGGAYPIRLADIQGPLDSAALVFGHTGFLAAMHTNPAEVHHLLRIVTDLIIRFARAQRDLVQSREVEFVPAMFQPWIPDGLGISVSNDECALISAAMHDEFSLPYLNEISDAFGGIYIHSCGRWAHQIPSLKKVRNLRGLEFGASEAPFEPVLEQFGGETVLAARIGLHRDLKFAGMADFVRRLRAASRTNRGLFIHVDITNGMVDDDWPATDLGEIYRLVGCETSPA
jgi:hypothetical protein